MGPSKKDFIQNILVSVISIGGASFFAFLLYQDLYLQKASVDGHLPAGQLADKHQNVKRKLGDNLIWDLIPAHEVLYWNDSIQTAEKGRARITLDNGSEITLGESSLVVLEKDNDQLNLELKSGQLVVASDSKDSGQSIKINGATVKRDAGQEVAIQMDDKKHIITATTTSTDGTAKQTTVDAKGNVAEKIIPVTLNSPPGLAHLTSEQNTASVSFKWQSSASQKTLQISKDQDFKNIVVQKELAENNFDGNLSGGSYFWRVKVADGQFSETRAFDIVKAVAPAEESLSGPGHVIFTTEAPLLEFKWAADPGVSKYILEISDSSSFKNSVFKAELTDNSLRTSDLKPGHLFWRVSSVFGEVVKTSATKTFELQRVAVAPPTDLTPAHDFKVEFAYFNQLKGIPFRWKMVTKDPCRFVFSKKSNLKDELVAFETTQNETLVKDNLEPGTYYWSVGSRDAEGQWSYSDIRKIEVGILVAPPEAPAALGPAETGDVDLLKNPILKWSWKEAAGAKEYHFRLVQIDGVKSDVVLDEKLKNLAKEKNDLPDGHYRWQISTLDSYGRESAPVSHEFNVTHGKSLEAPSFEMSEVQ